VRATTYSVVAQARSGYYRTALLNMAASTTKGQLLTLTREVTVIRRRGEQGMAIPDMDHPPR